MTHSQLQALLQKNPSLAIANPSLLPQPENSSSNSTITTSLVSAPHSLPKAIRGSEKLEHISFANFLRLHNAYFIHAPTYRKVRELPPGWPDFTIFNPPSTSALFIELKVQGGFISELQQHFIASFPATKIAHSALEAISLARLFLNIPSPP